MSPTTGYNGPTYRCEDYVFQGRTSLPSRRIIPPELARMLAARNGLELPADLFGADGHYIWRDFLSFLRRLRPGLRRASNAARLRRLLYSYLQRTAAQGAVYVEMFCSPERPKGLGIPYAAWVGALADAIDRARRDFGIEARIIGICIRHLGPGRALGAGAADGGRAASLCRGARHGWRRSQVHARRFRAGL